MSPESAPRARAPRLLPTAALVLPLLLLPLTPAAHAQPPEPQQEPDGLEQTVDPDERNVVGEAVLNIGHVDIGPRFVDGRWRIQGRDDSQVPPVWRLLTDVVTQVTDEAVQLAPDDEQFSFLDAEPGSEVHVVPQTQAPGVIWLGWNTQDPEVMERVNRGVTLTMLGATGPGQLSVFLQDGAFGPPDVLWDSNREGRQELWVDVNTHTHANWVFTEPGVYVVDFEVAADLITGERVADRAALRFAVGDGTDVDDAFAVSAAPGPEAEENEPVPDAVAAGPQSDSRAADGGSSLAAPIAVAGGALLLLLAAVAAVTVRGRRARRLADAAGTHDGGAR